ncbi:MAG: hypothetical protein Q9M97_09335, partial [Candidatus Gracilibacteria bacterium]|nr:hypothetical protein [Candidatus Gracilibacteria bacterium]
RKKFEKERIIEEKKFEKERIIKVMELAAADKRWDKLEKQYGIFGNFVNNDGAVVEEYFYTALDKANELHGETYDYFSQGEKHYLSRGNEQEFDIIGYNGEIKSQ